MSSSAFRGSTKLRDPPSRGCSGSINYFFIPQGQSRPACVHKTTASRLVRQGIDVVGATWRAGALLGAADQMDLDGQREALCLALVRVAAGEAPALKEVYDRTSAKLFGVCLRILGEPSEAEDVLQEVYLSVWRGAAAFSADRASPITWLAAIARHRAIDRLRARRPGRSEPIDAADDVADGAPSALDLLQESEGARRLAGCLGELEGPFQNAIRAAFLDGFTYEALAQRAGVPLGTMKSWIRRSLLKLRACVNPILKTKTKTKASAIWRRSMCWACSAPTSARWRPSGCKPIRPSSPRSRPGSAGWRP